MRKNLSEISMVLAGIGLSAVSLLSLWFWEARILYFSGFIISVFVFLLDEDE